MGLIYQISNIRTGKRYVGKTIAPLRERVRRHFSNARASNRHSNTYLCRAIRKYGAESFVCEPLAQFSDETQLADAEQLFITELKTKAPNGYNLTEGGDGLRGYVVSEATREKLRQAGLGNKRPPMTAEHRAALIRGLKRPRSLEFRRKRSEYMQLHNPMQGKTHSPEARKKISDARRRRTNA